MRLIVGLGNPGKKYEKTRHNIGFVVLDKLHEKLDKNNISNWELSKKFNASISGCVINNEKVLLAKPMTFMNSSGQAVQLIAHFYKIPARDIWIVHDDKDIELGQIKIQNKRGPAGHNGVKSIIDNINSQDITRVRVGIAPINKKKLSNIAKFVLQKFSLLERKKAEAGVEKAVEEIKKNLNYV